MDWDGLGWADSIERWMGIGGPLAKQTGSQTVSYGLFNDPLPLSSCWDGLPLSDV